MDWPCNEVNTRRHSEMMQAVATVAVTEAWAGSPQCPQLNCHSHVPTKYGSMDKDGQNNDANSKLLADALSIYCHFQQQTRIETGNAAPATLPYVGKRTAGLIV